MGELVREHGLIPDVVISSDAVRARLTAEAVVEAARYAGEILLDPRLYMAGPADIRDALAMLDDGRIRAEGIVTHHVPFDDMEEAFRLARTGEALKVVIDF